MKLFSLMSILSLFGIFSCNAQGYKNLDIDAFAQKAAEPAVALVDIRTADEYAEGHLEGAANIDWFGKDFLTQIEAKYPKETPLAIYCRSGRRSAAAAKALSKAGYEVYNMLGGIKAWTAAEKPVEK